MKKHFLKSLLAIACLLCSFNLYAHSFEVDGIKAFSEAPLWRQFTKITDSKISTQTPSVQFVYEGRVLESGAVIEITEFDSEMFVMPWNVSFQNNVEKDIEVVMSYEAMDNKYPGRDFMALTAAGRSMSGESVVSPLFIVDAGGNPNCTVRSEFMIWSDFFDGHKDAYIKADFRLENAANSNDYTYVTVIFDYSKADNSGDNPNQDPDPETQIYYKIINEAEKNVEVTYKDDNYNSYSGAINIPETIEIEGVTYSVTSIGDFAFYNCTGLTEVTIPNSVTSIGEGAFGECI